MATYRQRMLNYIGKAENGVSGGELMTEFAKGTRASRVMFTLFGLEITNQIESESCGDRVIYRKVKTA